MGLARKLVLPVFEVTEIAKEGDTDAIAVRIPQCGTAPGTDYHLRPVLIAETGDRRDGKPRWAKHQFNLFPVVLGGDGVPWAEANLYILARIENTIQPSMATFAAIAEDLAAYRRFLDETGVDWTAFPKHKLDRATYRYYGHLKYAAGAGEIAVGTAKRRMSAVIGFYRWLKSEGALVPENAPWKESDRFIEFKSAHGFSVQKKIVTTDVSINIPKQIDPYHGYINDGGKLRPLPLEEQIWLVEALEAADNPEMTLIHLMPLITGARIQTVLTFRMRHALLDLQSMHSPEVRFPVGPGTGIDTKNDKQMVLHIPVWFYQNLQSYALSDRARTRREKAAGGNTEDQYLFLSVRGEPLYSSKRDARTFNVANQLHHAKIGQGVRQFITERVIPYVRAKHGVPGFHYRFHDLRATFGMNLTDHRLQMVEKGEATLHQVREFVKTRMGHASAATTDLYLQYRQNLKFVRQVSDDYDSHLRTLTERATWRLD